ncbi:hypothetical protein HDC35_003801 [Sphingopyxis sp. JAI128]|nr:hypothetical protein [Sphingopyxis sp. JAI128]
MNDHAVETDDGVDRAGHAWGEHDIVASDGQASRLAEHGERCDRQNRSRFAAQTDRHIRAFCCGQRLLVKVTNFARRVFGCGEGLADFGGTHIGIRPVGAAVEAAAAIEGHAVRRDQACADPQDKHDLIVGQIDAMDAKIGHARIDAAAKLIFDTAQILVEIVARNTDHLCGVAIVVLGYTDHEIATVAVGEGSDIGEKITHALVAGVGENCLEIERPSFAAFEANKILDIRKGDGFERAVDHAL